MFAVAVLVVALVRDTLRLEPQRVPRGNLVGVACPDTTPIVAVSGGLGEGERIVRLTDMQERALPIVGASQVVATGSGRVGVYVLSRQLLLPCTVSPLVCDRAGIIRFRGPFLYALDTLRGGWAGVPLESSAAAVVIGPDGEQTPIGDQPRVASDTVSNARMLQSTLVVLGNSALLFRRYTARVDLLDMSTGVRRRLETPESFPPVVRTFTRGASPGFQLLPETRIAYTWAFPVGEYAAALYSGSLRGSDPRAAVQATRLRVFDRAGRLRLESELPVGVLTGTACADGTLYFVGGDGGTTSLWKGSLELKR